MSIGSRGNSPRRYLISLLLFALSSCGERGNVEILEDIEDLDFHRGRNAMTMARYDWARFYFTADLKTNPDRAESLRGLGLGWISGYQGSLTHGIEALEEYLKLAPEDYEIHLRLARSWLQTGERGRARQALEGLDKSLERELLITRILLAEDPESARDQISATLSMAPNHFEARLLAAQVYARLGEDTEALHQARRAAEIEPLSAELFYMQAQILRRQGSPAEAKEALATYELLRQLPGPGSPPNPRNELVLLRLLEERLAPTSPAPTSPAPISPAFKKRLARLLLETGRIDEATRLLEEIRAALDDDLVTRLVLAQVAHTQGRTAIAHDLYQDVLDRDPTDQKALAQQGLLAYETHDFEAAHRLLKRGLELDPHYAPLHFTRGLLALAQGEDEQAVQALTTAVHLVPWLGRYRMTLADVLLTQGDRDAFDLLLTEAPAPDSALNAYIEKHTL
jgi:tetratricopeptide (TPR) repeat protein